MYHKDIFCMRVKKLRKNTKEQQKDLAEAIGVSQAAISDIENGRRTTSFENLASICTHYNVSALSPGFDRRAQDFDTAEERRNLT